jgi:hypothetical protein
MKGVIQRDVKIICPNAFIPDLFQIGIHTMTTYRKAMTHLIQQYRGRLVDVTGDNLVRPFPTFSSKIIEVPLAQCYCYQIWKILLNIIIFRKQTLCDV